MYFDTSLSLPLFSTALVFYLSFTFSIFKAFALWLIFVICSLLQLEEGSVDLFSKTVKDDRIEIDMQANESLKTIDRYVQAWRNQIWDHGFMGWFRGADTYSKSKAFTEHKHTDLAVKRVLFRYKIISQMIFYFISSSICIEVEFLVASPCLVQVFHEGASSTWRSG
jgi:hypothetical protein